MSASSIIDEDLEALRDVVDELYMSAHRGLRTDDSSAAIDAALGRAVAIMASIRDSSERIDDDEEPRAEGKGAG